MKNMSNGFGRQPYKPTTQNSYQPKVSNSSKIPSSSNLKPAQTFQKENATANIKSTTTVQTRNMPTSSSGFNKPVQSKVPVKKEQQPIKYEYAVQEPKEIRKPVKPTGTKGNTTAGGASFRQPMVVDQHLEECKECGRKFNEKALAKHEKICKKVFSQKRKVFNSAKQRIVSKEQAQVLKKAQVNQKYQQKEQKITESEIPKWKQDSLAFRVAMKQAKGVAPTPQELKLAQQVKDSSSGLKLCKFCNRKFSEVAAEKHIPFCERKAKEINAKKPVRR